MHLFLRHTVTLAVVGLLVAPSARAQHTAMPAGMTHEEHMAQMKKDAEMKEHGNMAMGFDQDKTTHHFSLTADGGSIAVDANDPADQTSRDQIRTHLKEIAVAFGQGDFGKPLMTHSEFPAGVPVMQRLKNEISYVFQETARGGIVRMSTSNAEARAAIHEFLTYQITEHATGDPLAVPDAAAQCARAPGLAGRRAQHGRASSRSLRPPFRQRRRMGEDVSTTRRATRGRCPRVSSRRCS